MSASGLTHKFSIGGHEGYLTVGLYPDTNQPGEIFIRMSKEGSSISGLMDSFATAISLALQYGVPLSTLVNKFIHSRFEPSGFTGNKEIPMAKSVMDYIFRYLALKLPRQKDDRRNVGLLADQDDSAYAAAPAKLPAPDRPRTDARSGSLSNGNGKNGKRQRFQGQRPGPPRRHQRHGLHRRPRARDLPDAVRRPALPRVRCHHDPQRCLLPLHLLRHEPGLFVKRKGAG